MRPACKTSLEPSLGKWHNHKASRKTCSSCNASSMRRCGTPSSTTDCINFPAQSGHPGQQPAMAQPHPYLHPEQSRRSCKNITPTGIKSVLAPRRGCPIEHQIPSRQFFFLLWVGQRKRSPPAGMKAISARVNARLQRKKRLPCTVASL